MGLFDRGRERRKNRRNSRQENRRNRRAERQARLRLRQQGRTTRTNARTDVRMTAYEHGQNPYQWVDPLAKMGGDIAGSFFRSKGVV